MNQQLIQLSLSVDNVNQILMVLGKEPYNMVHQLVHDIVNQSTLALAQRAEAQQAEKKSDNFHKDQPPDTPNKS